MCKLGDGLRSKQFPTVLYTDNSRQGKDMQQMLDSAGIPYEIADARKEKMSSPVLVANGAFLGFKDVKEILSLA
jgi:glutaredoxin